MESFTCYGGGTFEIHEDHFVKYTNTVAFFSTKLVPTNIPFEQIRSITSYKKGTLRMLTASISIDTGAYNNVANRLPNEIEFKTNEEMENAYKKIMNAYNSYMAKKNGGATTIVQSSPADELKKFKELLDSGVITQAEFDAKKKQLLGL